MNMIYSIRLLLVVFTSLLVTASATACPDCALLNSGGTIEPQTVMAKMAFSVSTLLMIGIFFTVVGFMTWMMVKTCRDLAKERPLSAHGEK
jgi:heme/copper-type cytochrome/quinol oxidase subunit 2